MKKTLTVNLGGTVFHIDEDAYRLLDNYLCNLKLHFRKQEGAEEIVTDIETRISELFVEKLNAGLQVITLTNVEEVIARMGKPEDIDGAAEEEPKRSQESVHTNVGSGSANGSSTYRHRFYRNPDGKMLGGVAGGIAAYFDWDATLVRILFICLLFLPYSPIILFYIIAWIVIPEARTAADKLSMRGEAVTIENIGRTVTDGFEKVASGVNDYVNSGKPRSLLRQLGDGLVQVAAFFLKACLVLIAIVFSPVLFVLALMLVALLFAAIALLVGGGAVLFDALPMLDWAPLNTISPLMTVVGTIAGIVLIGIPLATMVYAVLRQLFNWSPMAAALKWSLFALWVLGLVLFILNLSALGWQLPLCGIHPV